MNNIEQWYLKKLFKREVIQSPEHRNNILKLYTMIVEAARNEFTEDNKSTLDSFLKEIHQEALDS